MDIYDCEIIITPLNKYYRIYQSLNLTGVKTEYTWKIKGDTYVLYSVNDNSTARIAQLEKNIQCIFRFKERTYHRFHESEWQRTNSIKQL